MNLVENLRRYVGEQVAPEVQSRTWESERQELLETVQVRECRVHLCQDGEWDWRAQGSGLGRGVAPGEENSPQERRHCC